MEIQFIIYTILLIGSIFLAFRQGYAIGKDRFENREKEIVNNYANKFKEKLEYIASLPREKELTEAEEYLKESEEYEIEEEHRKQLIELENILNYGTDIPKKDVR
jgi:hypothetical protein